MSTLVGAGFADAFEFAFLKHAKQLHLKLGRRAVDFIEKDAAGVGGFKPAGAIIDSARERAFDVSEQFGFEQALGKCATVDADVRARLARAEVVDASDQFSLLRAGLTDDQHGCARGRDLAGGPCHFSNG